MRMLVESLKRLFMNGKITEDRLNEMVESRKITPEEKSYIVSRD